MDFARRSAKHPSAELVQIPAAFEVFIVTEKTIFLPDSPGNGAQYRLTTMVPKRRFFSYLRERWWVALICLVCSLAIVLVYETIRTPRYRSIAQLYVSTEMPANPMGFFMEDPQNYFGTQIELLKSPRLQNAVYQQLGVSAATGKKSLVDITVTQPLRTSLLNVEATGADRDLVQRFLQSLISEYLAYKKETRLASSEDLLNSITEQVALKGTSLESEQQKWADFQKTNNLAVLEEDGKSAGMYLSDLNLQLAKLRLEQKILSQVSDAGPHAPAAGKTNLSESEMPAAAAAEEGDTNQISQDDDMSLKSARVELAVLLGDKEEKVRAMGQKRFEEEVGRLQQYIAILENDSKNRRALQIEDLNKRIAAISDAIPLWERKMSDINQRLAQAQQLKNNIARQQEFYDHLLGTMQNVDLNKNVQQERLSLLQAATSAMPQNRSLPLRIALAAFGGLAFSLAIVFLWYLLDDRLVSVRDINDQFGEPVLGLVPQVRVPRANPERALLESNDSRTAYAESFRHLRSALMLSKPGQAAQCQTLLFTSAMPNEGKTTVAVNVARVLARSGLRVALVDADLHSAGSKKFFGDSDSHGLMNFLRGEVNLETVLRVSDIPGLTIIGGGTFGGETEGLFLRPRLEDLIKHLREQNHFVILDGAPVLSADDPALLVPHADSVVLVTRPFHTRSRLIRQALDMLYQRRAKQVTLILNRARSEDLAGYYADSGVSRNGKNSQPVIA